MQHFKLWSIHTKLYNYAISIQQRNVIIEGFKHASAESVGILHKCNIFSSGATNRLNWVWHVKIAPFLWNMAIENLNILLEIYRTSFVMACQPSDTKRKYFNWQSFDILKAKVSFALSALVLLECCKLWKLQFYSDCNRDFANAELSVGGWLNGYVGVIQIHITSKRVKWYYLKVFKTPFIYISLFPSFNRWILTRWGDGAETFFTTFLIFCINSIHTQFEQGKTFIKNIGNFNTVLLIWTK